MRKTFMMFGLFVVMGAVSLQAASNVKVVATVPFDFMVGATTLPAGDYVVRQDISPFVLSVQNDETYQTAMVLANPALARQNVDEVKLVFERHGKDHFLLEVWDGSETGHKLVTPDFETMSMPKGS